MKEKIDSFYGALKITELKKYSIIKESIKDTVLQDLTDEQVTANYTDKLVQGLYFVRYFLFFSYDV